MVRKTGSHERWNKVLLSLLLVTALGTSIVLAGCTSNDDLNPPGTNGDKGSIATGGGGDGGPGANGGDPAAQGERFRFTRDNITARQMTASGSFSPTQHCVPVNCFIGDDHLHPVDLEEILPVGIPVHVEVELTGDDDFFPSFVSGFFRSEGAMWNMTPLQGTYRGESLVTVLPDHNAKLYYVVEGTIPDLETETSWTLDVTATPILDHVPAGFPVGFQVDEPGTPPVIRSLGAGIATFMLWNGDDEYLGTFTTASNLTAAFEESDPGEFVLFSPWDGADLFIGSAKADALMRVLDIELSTGDLQEPGPLDPAEWEFTLERMPLAVGLMLQTEQGIAFELNSTILLESSAGEVLEEEHCFFCGHLLTFTTIQNYRYEHATHPAIIEGTYRVYYADKGTGRSIAEAVWSYER